MRLQLVVLGASLIIAAPVSAQDDCTRAATTVAMVDCHSAELRTAQEELQALTTRLRGRATHGERALLEAAEQAWLAFVNAECRWAASQYEGGSFASIVAVTCRLRLTRERRAHLQDRLDGGGP